MTRLRLLTGGVLLLLFPPLGCDMQRDNRAHTLQEDGLSMTAPKETSTPAEGASPTRAGAEEVIMPIVQEELHIATHQVETGRVRLTKTVHEREVVVKEPSIHEEVQVERIPVNRFVTEPIAVRYEGDTMIIPVMEEVPVVETRLRLKEELRVTKRRVTTPRSQPVRLRTEEVQVQRVPSQREPLGPSTHKAGGAE